MWRVVAATGLILLPVTLLAQSPPHTPPFAVHNCLRSSGDCQAAFTRAHYPKVFAEYLFESARATFEQQARLKLRSYKPPELVLYRFDIGDSSIPVDSVRVERKAMFLTKPSGFGTESTLAAEQQTVSLPEWFPGDDVSPRLFILGWLSIWNSQLVDPFPVQCAVHFDMQKRTWVQTHFGCVDLTWMLQLSLANAKFHQGMRPVADRYSGAPIPFFQNTRQRWLKSC